MKLDPHALRELAGRPGPHWLDKDTVIALLDEHDALWSFVDAVSRAGPHRRIRTFADDADKLLATLILARVGKGVVHSTYSGQRNMQKLTDRGVPLCKGTTVRMKDCRGRAWPKCPNGMCWLHCTGCTPHEGRPWPRTLGRGR